MRVAVHFGSIARGCGVSVFIAALGMSFGPILAQQANQSGTSGAVAQSQASWPSDTRGLRLHMIGNAHIDAPWLWPLSETNAVVHSTFRSALDRLKEDPQITMT